MSRHVSRLLLPALVLAAGCAPAPGRAPTVVKPASSVAISLGQLPAAPEQPAPAPEQPATPPAHEPAGH